MIGLHALRLAINDLWEESSLVLSSALLGGLLSLLLFPFPFVLAAHYGTADRIGDQLVVSWRTWLQAGRAHARFFYKWFLLVAFVSLVFLSNLYFYSRFEAWWATALRWLVAGLLLFWLLPQPLVPALYFQQSDRRLRVALRNALVICLTDPLAIVVLWAATLLLAIPLASVALPLLLLLQMFIALLSTRIIGLKVKSPATEPERP
jgi:hypothetical protein